MSSADSEEKGARGNSKQAQLLVLLALVAGFGYIYFFTGLIKPRQEAAKSPEQSALVKKPMPLRGEQKPSAEAGQGQQLVAAVKTPAPSAVQNAAAPKSAGAAVSPKQETSKTAKTEEPAKAVKTETLPPKDIKSEVPAKQKTPVSKAPVQAVKKQEPAEQKTPVKQGATKAEIQVKGKADPKTAPAKQAAKSAPVPDNPKSAAKSGAGVFTLKIGEFPLVKDVAVVEAKLKKAGITHISHLKLTKTEPMHRLFYAEYPSRESAAADLEQLRAKAPDAFVIQENGKFSVYAGSYFNGSRGATEQVRLSDKGIRLVIKKTKVGLPVTELHAGSFASQKEASAAAARLKKRGLNATVIKAVKKAEIK